VPNGDGAPKPGFIVDGQQRSAAVRDAEVESVPLCVVAFVAASEEEQREQFVLVNSAKPLPKALIYELLPSMSDGASLEQRRIQREAQERRDRETDRMLDAAREAQIQVEMDLQRRQGR
jgi:DGQHR domain-containing protein